MIIIIIHEVGLPYRELLVNCPIVVGARLNGGDERPQNLACAWVVVEVWLRTWRHNPEDEHLHLTATWRSATHGQRPRKHLACRRSTGSTSERREASNSITDVATLQGNFHPRERAVGREDGDQAGEVGAKIGYRIRVRGDNVGTHLDPVGERPHRVDHKVALRI